MTVVVATQDIDIGARLGAGAFGQVHRGVLRPFGDVAVKIVQPSSAGPFSLWKEYLFAEADRLHAAEHQHVVRFLACSYDATSNRVFIVTELCRTSVGDEAGDDPVPLNKLQPIAREALLGLEALHQRGMIHRDIKPGNLLLAPSGRTKLADFGLVSDDLVAGYGSYNGYYFHLAPEVLAKRTTSTKTDVWAMGVTLYRLLNGETWWNEYLETKGIGPTDVNTIKSNILGGNFAGKLPWMPHVPDAWRRFLRAALHDDATKRFQNATGMLSAMASLPSSPSWLCTCDPTTVRWWTDAQQRRTVVEWTGRRTRSHRVRKWSEPLAGVSGRPRSFGEVVVGRFEDARRQAEVFLGTRTT